jgi:hypothetical protein
MKRYSSKTYKISAKHPRREDMARSVIVARLPPQKAMNTSG